jgi:hypothetical protein
MTSRELALEAAVRFTDRNKFAIDTMLKNADKIEAWLNRDQPENSGGIEAGTKKETTIQSGNE